MPTMLERAKVLLQITWVKWTAVGVGAVVGLVVVAYLALYVASEWRLARTYEAPEVTLRAAGPPSASRGERLAKVFGCQGCHGAAGRVFVEEPGLGRFMAPNLTRIAAEYSDEELVRAIRFGIKRDKTSAVVMPTDAFSWMADDDLADIIAWLRSLKPVADANPLKTSWGPLARFAFFQSWFPFSAEMPRAAAPPVTRPTGSAVEEGDYLVKVVCDGCHRLDEEHQQGPEIVVPALRPMAQSYDLAQFTELLRTGEAIGDRKLGLMAEVAKNNFRHLTDGEIAAIHTYLNALEAPDQ